MVYPILSVFRSEAERFVPFRPRSAANAERNDGNTGRITANRPLFEAFRSLSEPEPGRNGAFRPWSWLSGERNRTFRPMSAPQTGRNAAFRSLFSASHRACGRPLKGAGPGDHGVLAGHAAESARTGAFLTSNPGAAGATGASATKQGVGLEWPLVTQCERGFLGLGNRLGSVLKNPGRARPRS